VDRWIFLCFFMFLMTPSALFLKVSGRMRETSHSFQIRGNFQSQATLQQSTGWTAFSEPVSVRKPVSNIQIQCLWGKKKNFKSLTMSSHIFKQSAQKMSTIGFLSILTMLSFSLIYKKMKLALFATCFDFHAQCLNFNWPWVRVCMPLDWNILNDDHENDCCLI
jgi:hypothetical protein